MSKREDLIYLTNGEGEEMGFEPLDMIEYEGQKYIILCPPQEVQIVILRYDGLSADGQADSYSVVDDDAALKAVFDIFREKALKELAKEE